jgi:DNA-binding Lrp family transcriptional regulator
MPESRTPLDQMDRNILAELQKDARLTSHELGQRLGLSASQAGRRRQRLESEGIITHYTARLAPTALGLSVQAFIEVTMASHGVENAHSFMRLVGTRPEVTSAWTLTGAADYMLRCYCDDLPALNRLIHEVLLPHASVSRVQSQIVMDQFKIDAPLPL